MIKKDLLNRTLFALSFTVIFFAVSPTIYYLQNHTKYIASLSMIIEWATLICIGATLTLVGLLTIISRWEIAYKIASGLIVGLAASTCLISMQIADYLSSNLALLLYLLILLAAVIASLHYRKLIVAAAASVLILGFISIFTTYLKSNYNTRANSTTDFASLFSLYEKKLPQYGVYKLGKTITFGEESHKYLKEGWSGPQADYRWTDGPQSQLIFKVKDTFSSPLILKLHAGVFLANGREPQQVTLLVNEKLITTWTMGGLNWYEASIPNSIVKNGIINIKFLINKPTAPCDVLPSKDCRKLGILAKELVIDKQKSLS